MPPLTHDRPTLRTTPEELLRVAADRTDDLARALRLRVGERAVSVEDALGLVLVESLAAATGGTA